MATGLFDNRLKNYYQAVAGGFTTVTLTEVTKGTYNVKACIRKMLITRLGRKNIPRDTPMQFHAGKHIPAEYGTLISLMCKFSKPASEEMTLYLPRKLDLKSGDVWCIYFKEGDILPWFDFIRNGEWEQLNNHQIGDLVVEPDEIRREKSGQISSLTYNHPVADLNIHETLPPAGAPYSLQTFPQTPQVINTQKMEQVQKNQKIKGNRGEEIVLRIEKERLIAAGRKDLAEAVKWISSEYDGYGYDIESFERNPDTSEWEPIYIEVKTTSHRDPSAPFYISENERRVSAEKGSAYYIYRVFAVTPNSRDISYYRINGYLGDCFALQPHSYIAQVK